MRIFLVTERDGDVLDYWNCKNNPDKEYMAIQEQQYQEYVLGRVCFLEREDF